MTASATAKGSQTVASSELRLLRQFAVGNVDAFETLFRQYQAEVYRWIVRIVRDHAIAEDLTIETFWRVHRAHARFDPERSFGAWVRRIASNVAFDHLKSARPAVELRSNLSAPSVDTVRQQHIHQQTAIAFQRLPAKLRIVATLALVEERSYTEIAEGLGVSLSAVKTRAFRAVRRLRKELKQLGVEP